MTPQILDLKSEALAEFRDKFDSALAILIRNMIDKDLRSGEVSGKVRIELNSNTTDDGEIIWTTELKPDVHLKVGAKGKLECGTVGSMIVKTSPCGMPVVATNQITMDELLKAEKGA